MIRLKNEEKIIKLLARIKKELTEKQITLTQFFNLCLKYKNPNSKMLEQSRPSSAINAFDKARQNSESSVCKIDSHLMRDVFQTISIFIPFEEYQVMLNTFKLTKKRYISYEEFLKVFTKTHYPQPFVRSTHIEPKEVGVSNPYPSGILKVFVH